MSTPYHLAKKAFEAEPSSFKWEEYLYWHYVNGCIFSRPDFFIGIRPVRSRAEGADIVDPRYRFHSAECDCWHVGIMAGNMAKAWDFLPWPMRWMSYERENRLRIVSLESIRRLSTLDNL